MVGGGPPWQLARKIFLKHPYQRFCLWIPDAFNNVHSMKCVIRKMLSFVSFQQMLNNAAENWFSGKKYLNSFALVGFFCNRIPLCAVTSELPHRQETGRFRAQLLFNLSFFFGACGDHLFPYLQVMVVPVAHDHDEYADFVREQIQPESCFWHPPPFWYHHATLPLSTDRDLPIADVSC